MSETEDSAICQACGACCAFDSSWPRFSLESDEDLARIPEELVNAKQSGMAFTGCQCSALDGKVGSHVSCRIYQVRPIVCRDCLPGDDACTMARALYNLAPLPPRSM